MYLGHAQSLGHHGVRVRALVVTVVQKQDIEGLLLQQTLVEVVHISLVIQNRVTQIHHFATTACNYLMGVAADKGGKELVVEMVSTTLSKFSFIVSVLFIIFHPFIYSLFWKFRCDIDDSHLCSFGNYLSSQSSYS